MRVRNAPPLYLRYAQGTDLHSPEPTGLFFFFNIISAIFGRLFSVIKIFPWSYTLHACLSQILIIILFCGLDFQKENAGMLSAPFHTSAETRYPRASGLLEPAKQERKYREKKAFAKHPGHSVTMDLKVQTDFFYGLLMTV